MKIVEFDNNFLDLSFDWLQKDAELKWLTVTNDFSKESQANWFNSLPLKTDYKIFGIKINDEPAGAFGIKNIQNGTGEYWGYIAIRAYLGKGYGKILMQNAFDQAQKLGLNSLYLYVKNLENKRAINLYLSVGFDYIETGSDYVKMQKKIPPHITKEAEQRNVFEAKIFFAQSARATFSNIVSSVFKNSDKKILMPAYIGETDKEGSGVFDPIRENRLKFEFYKIEKDLSGNIDDIIQKITSGKFGAILIIHYFGFIQNNMEEIVKLCEYYDVALIEDCAHSFLTVQNEKKIGQFGDFSFYSIHKIIPSLDGGFFKINKTRYYCSEVVEPNKKISLDSLDLYVRSDYETIKQKRVENYSYYIENWKSNDLISPLYPTLPKGIVPLNFPIIVKNRMREKCYFKLIDRNILTCSLYYRMIKEIDKDIFPLSYEIADNILNLPVHQDTNKDAIEYILKNLFEIIEELIND